MLRVSSLFLVFFISLSFFSQESDTSLKYKPSFGFNFGTNYSALWNYNATDELQIKNGFGFRLGVTSSFHLKRNWFIDPKIELSFNNASITEDNVTYQVDPNNLNFMTHFKYRMKGYNGMVKPYCYFGPNLRVPLPGEDVNAYATRTTLSLDFAFGVDIELKHFNISPELRFSGGLMDVRQNPVGTTLRGSNAAFVIGFSGK